MCHISVYLFWQHTKKSLAALLKSNLLTIMRNHIKVIFFLCFLNCLNLFFILYRKPRPFCISFSTNNISLIMSGVVACICCIWVNVHYHFCSGVFFCENEVKWNKLQIRAVCFALSECVCSSTYLHRFDTVLPIVKILIIFVLFVCCSFKKCIRPVQCKISYCT